MYFILSFKIMYLKARGWAVRLEYVAWIDNNNKMYSGWVHHVYQFQRDITKWNKFYINFYKQCSELPGSTHSETALLINFVTISFLRRFTVMHGVRELAWK
jgi:hypothetical protein